MATRALRTQKKSPESTVPARLDVPESALNALGLDLNTWKVLTDSIFPSAKTAEGILLAVRYCQARGLDVLKRPVHVVPMWSKALGHEVETIWPGIAEVQTTAARTREWAGMDAPRFGPDETQTFRGRVKRDEHWEELQVSVTFPSWCEVTVYRLIGGTRCPFTETVFWEETYSRMNGGDVPTAMWIKRPRGQLLKCAKAASLRAAFPEEASYTAEEMAGKQIEPEELVVNAEPKPVPAEAEPVGIDAAFKAKVAKLIERAVQAQAWAPAESYIQTRFQGEQLAYALRELAQAQAASTQAKAA
jgi:phage recombination protein Bet